MLQSAPQGLTQREDNFENNHNLILEGALHRLEVLDQPPAPVPDLLAQRSLAGHRAAIDAVAGDLPGTEEARSLVASAFLDWRIAEGSRQVQAFDPATFCHMARVGVVGAFLADTMGHTILETRVVTYAGLLHDLGKVGIDHSIIQATDGPHAESNEIDQSMYDRRFVATDLHPEIGFRIIRNLFRDEPHRILSQTMPQLVLGHHCFNHAGRTYPTLADQKKLIEEGLLAHPLGLSHTVSRLTSLLALADIYEAITAHRGYYGNRFDNPDNVAAALEEAQPDLVEARAILMGLHMQRIHQ